MSLVFAYTLTYEGGSGEDWEAGRPWPPRNWPPARQGDWYTVTFLCGRSREYLAVSEQDARDQAQSGPSVHIVSVTRTSVLKTPFREPS
jgi:hypothetical protein